MVFLPRKNLSGISTYWFRPWPAVHSQISKDPHSSTTPAPPRVWPLRFETQEKAGNGEATPASGQAQCMDRWTGQGIGSRGGHTPGNAQKQNPSRLLCT